MDPRVTLSHLISGSNTRSREVVKELPPQEIAMEVLQLEGGLETEVPRGHTDILPAAWEVERVFILGGSM